MGLTRFAACRFDCSLRTRLPDWDTAHDSCPNHRRRDSAASRATPRLAGVALCGGAHAGGLAITRFSTTHQGRGLRPRRRGLWAAASGRPRQRRRRAPPSRDPHTARRHETVRTEQLRERDAVKPTASPLAQLGPNELALGAIRRSADVLGITRRERWRLRLRPRSVPARRPPLPPILRGPRRATSRGSGGQSEQ